MRPDEDESGRKHEDDLFSDEDVDVDEVDEGTRRRVHVGGTRMEDESRETTAAVAEARRQSADAMKLSDRAWRRQAADAGDGPAGAWAKSDGRANVSDAEVKRKDAEARASKPKNTGEAWGDVEREDGRVTENVAGGAAELRAWRAKSRGPNPS